MYMDKLQVSIQYRHARSCVVTLWMLLQEWREEQDQSGEISDSAVSRLTRDDLREIAEKAKIKIKAIAEYIFT